MQAFPKIELHRHLEGSVDPETLLHIVRTWGGSLPAYDLEELRRHVQMRDQEPGFAAFLAKFSVYRGFYPCRAAIEYAVRRAIDSAADDGVKYLELRYSPTHFAALGRFRERDVVDWIHGTMQATAAERGIIVVPLLTISRDFGYEKAAATVRLALELPEGYFYGLDIAGNELENPAAPFAGLFRAFKDRGLGITIHAGEAGGPQNVREAVERFGARRIGHGIASAADPGLMDLLLERDVLLEVCLTSNVHTGSVPSIAAHPLPALVRHNVPFCLNTDDPAISSITLSGEYALAKDLLGCGIDMLKNMNRTALAHAFHPDPELLSRKIGHFWQ